MNDDISFGRVLKMFRQNAGISSRNLSQEVGKAPAYVSQIERNLIKNPDPYTAYRLLESVGCTRAQIEKILTDLKIADEKVLIDQKVFKEKIDPIYTEYKTDMTSEESKFYDLFNADELILMNKEVHNILNLFIKKDFSKAERVIRNIYSLVSKDKEHFDFFCSLHENDYSKLSNSMKNELIHEVKEKYNRGVK